MNTRLLVVGLLLAVGAIEAKSTYSRHKILRQLSTHCEEGKSKCPNSDTCIRDSWFCDGDNDCGDDSDEPSSCPPRECSGDTFKCVTRNRCLPLIAVCNGHTDCVDNSDEPEDCAIRECPDGFLRCNSGQCVDRADYCTASVACSDGSSLHAQTNCPHITCEPGYSKCPHLSKCIRNAYFCDGDNDCRDGSDETNCENRECNSGEFLCNNGQCIDNEAYCTGRDSYGCRDDTDKSSICENIQCPEGYEKCPSDGRCVSINDLCNGSPQCSDGWDEEDQHCDRPFECPSSAGQVRCPRARRCISAHYICDTDNDCGDNSDEEQSLCANRVCEPNRVQCNNGQCLDKESFCVGYQTCRDISVSATSDICPFTCTGGQSQCPGQRRCINTNYFCDTDNDCGDSSDEDPSLCANRECPAGSLTCNNGQCLSRDAYCRGEVTCRDSTPLHSHASCPEITCDPGYSKCPLLQRCIRNSYFCDGDNDCRDGSDEANCAIRVCPGGLVRCNNGQCLDRDEYCTGASSCRDGTSLHTEIVCPDITCEPGNTKCPHRSKCIKNSYFCDGDDDCRDGSDEANCAQRSTPSYDDPSSCMLAMGPGMGPAMAEQCGENEMFAGMSDRQKNQKMIETDLGELCRPVQSLLSCVENAFQQACSGVNHGIVADIRSTLDMYRIVLDYVCVEHLNVVNRNKACLLRLAANETHSFGPTIPHQIEQTAMTNCRHLLPSDQQRHRHPMCMISPELQACVKHVVAEQCGDEIAEILNGLGDRLREASDCPQIAHHSPPLSKRRGFPFDIKAAFGSFF